MCVKQKGLTLHSSLLGCLVNIDSKVRTLDDDKDSNDEEEDEKAQLDENVCKVCGGGFFSWEGGESLD